MFSLQQNQPVPAHKTLYSLSNSIVALVIVLIGFNFMSTAIKAHECLPWLYYVSRQTGSLCVIGARWPRPQFLLSSSSSLSVQAIYDFIFGLCNAKQAALYMFLKEQTRSEFCDKGRCSVSIANKIFLLNAGAELLPFSFFFGTIRNEFNEIPFVSHCNCLCHGLCYSPFEKMNSWRKPLWSLLIWKSTLDEDLNYKSLSHALH